PQREGEGPAMASPSPSSSPAASPSGRKVRDVAADWHNAIAKWDRLVVDSGLALASRVANSRLAAPHIGSVKKIRKEGDSAPTAEAASAAESTRSQELERDCDQLIEVWEKLRGLLQTMEKLTSTLQAVCDLEWYQNKQAWRPTPLFRSWPTTTFYEVSAQLQAQYSEELRLRRVLVAEMAHAPSPNLSMVYLSAWLHQPYVTDAAKLALEAMLTETGHRDI
uniref:Cyclin-dependent kinase 2 interacting protein n=1 Tax=Petromyzon marinus TaxID=7757 RepID=S4RGL5_PETMA